MTLLSMNARLLCGISVLFAVGGRGASVTETTALASARDDAEAATSERSAEGTATPRAAASHAAETEAAITSSSDGGTAGLMPQASAAVTTARPAGDAQAPRDTTISETVNPSTSTGVTAPETTSAAPEVEVTSNLPPSATSLTSRAISGPSPTAVAPEGSAASNSTSLPAATTETLPTGGAETSSSPQFPHTTGSSSPAETPTATASDGSSTSSASGASTSPTPAITAAPCRVSKTPPSPAVVRPCSTRSVMSHCLIAIGSLAVLASVFMVSTVVLCAKQSSRGYKVKRPKESTEMMCISALLPEEDFTYTRHRAPVTNGILVFPRARDSDEEGGDNVTLSSFLPENDHYV